ncbi:translesion error-prone DNA polymerase V autoproteolytic subunit [Patescibacteria group bacterium]|nr:translesion error-prone DNA polymerase V autoproteolytic subunit [Patescibacteria group bacterium]
MNINIKKLEDFYYKNKRLPSYSELAKLFNYKSKSSAFNLAKALIKKGILNKDNFGNLIPANNFLYKLKVLGEVKAGFPSAAEQEDLEQLSLDDYLIKNKEASFMLKVSGYSMKDAGILPGDMVLVDRSVKAQENDIVIAEVDNNWTMKYLKKNKSRVYLQAANKRYNDIYPQSDLKIAAVVKAVIRKY